MAHPELGSRILDAVIEQVGTHGKVETMARLEGRNMTMVLAPEKKAVVKKPHEARVHEDKHEGDKAADDAEAAAQSEQEEVAAAKSGSLIKFVPDVVSTFKSA